MDLDGSGTNDGTGTLGILDLSVFDLIALHLLVHHIGGLGDDVFQEDNVTLPSGHTLDKTESNKLEFVSVRFAHEFKRLEKLVEMQGLGGLDDIDVLVELILLILIIGTTEISGKVNRGTVTLPDNGLVHLELGQIDQQSSSVLTSQVLLLNDPDSSLYGLLRNLRFAPVDIKVDVELLVGALKLLDGKISESGPLGNRLRLAWRQVRLCAGIARIDTYHPPCP